MQWLLVRLGKKILVTLQLEIGALCCFFCKTLS
jgi:hypothetical protein